MTIMLMMIYLEPSFSMRYCPSSCDLFF